MAERNENMSQTQQKSDLSRAFSEDGELKTHVGGQALLEGIMMRGKYNWSVAVREPDGGIYTEEHDLAYGVDKSGWLYWPFVRGCRAFVESLALGYKALSIAAEHAFVEEEDEAASAEQAETAALPDDHNATVSSPEPLAVAPAAGEKESASGESVSENLGDTTVPKSDFSWKRDFGNPDEMIDALGAQRTLEVVDESGKPVRFDNDAVADAPGESVRSEHDAVAGEPGEGEGAPEKKPLLGSKEMAVSMVLGLVLGIVLFVVAPAFVTNLIVGEYDDNTLLWNIVDGLLRIAVFIFYIWLIGRMSDIKRMFGYHGAEHKTIHCFEHGLPLTPENARSFPRLHVRCGTAFLIMVMIIAIFVYTVTPVGALIDTWGVPDGAPKLALVIVVRILLMPVIAGIAYEITVKWAGSHPGNPLVKVILWPGMQMQYLTTREPDDGQIECAIAAMQIVLEREQRETSAA